LTQAWQLVFSCVAELDHPGILPRGGEATQQSQLKDLPIDDAVKTLGHPPTFAEYSASVTYSIQVT